MMFINSFWFNTEVTPPPPPGANLFIGGVAATIPDKATLATKLSITEADISTFTIVGSDIEARIDLSYAPVFQAFLNDLNITYFKSTEGKLTTTGGQSFGGSSLQFLEDELLTELGNSFANTFEFRRLTTPSVTSITTSGTISSSALLRLELANLVSVVDSAFSSSKARVFYLPHSSLTLGSTAANNSVFSGLLPGTKIYVNQHLATNNAGAPDGDLTNAISQGAEVTYITDTTPPAKITGITEGTVYATNVELVFTQPTSVNTLKSYQVFVNGEFNGEYAVGKKVYAAGLALNAISPPITVVAVDEFYNKSAASDPFTVTTTTIAGSPMQKTGLVSVHNFSELSGTTANDSYGSHHATSNEVFRNLKGSIGTTYLFQALSSSVIIPHSEDYNFTSAGSDLPFTLCFDLIFLKNQNSFVVGKTNGSVRIWEILYESGVLKFRQFSNGSANNRVEIAYTFSPVLGQKYAVCAQSNGTGLTGMELYFDNVKVGNSVTVGSYVSMKEVNTENVYVGKYPTITSYTLTGGVINLKIHKNYAFTATDRTNNYNNGNGVTL